MNRDWKLILEGLFLASVGFIGMVLYILGLSNLFIGKDKVGLGCLGGAVLVLLVFRKWLGAYLTALEADRNE